MTTDPRFNRNLFYDALDRCITPHTLADGSFPREKHARARLLNPHIRAETFFPLAEATVVVGGATGEGDVVALGAPFVELFFCCDELVFFAIFLSTADAWGGAFRRSLTSSIMTFVAASSYL